MTKPSELNSNRELQTSAEEEARHREFWENEDELISTRGTIDEMISSGEYDPSEPLWISILDTILWIAVGGLILGMIFAPEVYNTVIDWITK